MSIAASAVFPPDEDENNKRAKKEQKKERHAVRSEYGRHLLFYRLAYGTHRPRFRRDGALRAICQALLHS